MTDSACLALHCGAAAGVPCSFDAPTATYRDASIEHFCARCGATPGRRCIDLAMRSGHATHTAIPHRERWSLRGRRWVTESVGRSVVFSGVVADDGFEPVVGDWPWDGASPNG